MVRVVPQYDDVRPLLDPLAPALVRICEEAVQRHRRYVAPMAKAGDHIGARTHANLLNDLALETAKRSLADQPNVSFRMLEGLSHFVVSDEVLLFFKKANALGLASNYPTPQQDRFRKHQPLLGFPEGKRVHLIYEVDEMFSSLLDVNLVCLNGRRKKHWSIPVLEEVRAHGRLPLRASEERGESATG